MVKTKTNIGDFLFHRMNNVAPHKWILGHITELLNDININARVITVRTESGHVNKSTNEV